MSKTKKIFFLAMMPVAVLFLSGCGKQTTPTDQAAPKSPTAEQQKTPQSVSSTNQLPPLPTDNKQAIDSELQGIDQTLQDTDKALSADTADTELGL